MGDDSDQSGLEDAVFRAPPREFTGARDALAGALKAAGRGDDAKATRAWRRPTVPVWLWNRLVLEGEESAREALEVSAALARAIAGEDDDRAGLGRAIAALRRAGGAVVQRGAELAKGLGVGFSTAQERELADLVQALPWSEAARDAAARGRLHETPPPVDPLEAMRVLAGGPGIGTTDEADGEGADAAGDGAPDLRAQLEAEAEATRVALADAEAALARAERATRDARAGVARAEKQLAEATRAADEAAREETACASAVAEARERRDAAEAARVS